MTDDSTDFDVTVDPLELMDVTDEEKEEFQEKLDDMEPMVADYAHAIEEELETVNETAFMDKLGLEVIMDYNIEIQPRS